MPRIRWTGDASQLEKANKAIADGVKNIEKGLTDATKSGYALEKAAKKLAEQASPTAKYNAKLKELGEIVAKDAKLTDAAAMSLVKYRDQLSKNSEVGRKRWKEQTAAAAEAAKAAEQMAAKGRQITADNETHIERYRRQLLELGRTFRAGAIDQEAFVRAARKLKDESAKSDPSAKKAADAKAAAERKAAQAAKEGAAVQAAAAKRNKENIDAQAAALKRKIAVEEKSREEQNKMLAAGAKIRSGLETPTERYKRQVLELGKELRRATIDKETFVRGVRKYKEELEGAQNAGRQAFGSGLVDQLKSSALQIASIATATGLIRADWDYMKARAEEKAATQVSVGEAEEDLKRVIATDPNRDKLIATAQRIAKDRDLPLAQIYRAAEGAYASSSDAGLAAKMIEEASRQSRNPTRYNEIATGIGFVMQSAKISDPEEAAGLMNQVLEASPIKDEKVPQQVSKVIAAYMNPVAGGSAETAGAVLSTLSKFANDPEGDRSRTGAIQLTKKTKAFFDKNRGRLGLGAGQVDELDERMAYLMDDRNLGVAKEFMAATAFEAPVEGGMAKLFLDSDARSYYREKRGVMGDRDSRIAFARDTAEYIGTGNLQGTRRTNDALRSTVENRDLSFSDRGILTAEGRGDLEKLIAEAMGGYFSSTRAKGAIAISAGTEVTREEAIEILAGFHGQTSGDLRTEIRELVATLQRIEEESKRTANGVEEQNGKRRGGKAATKKPTPARK